MWQKQRIFTLQFTKLWAKVFCRRCGQGDSVYPQSFMSHSCFILAKSTAHKTIGICEMRRRFLSRSQSVQVVFWSILAVMVILGISAYRPPSPLLTSQQIEGTVQAMTVAELQRLQTVTADSWTPTPTLDFDATVSARLTNAPNWTLTPTLTPLPSDTPIASATPIPSDTPTPSPTPIPPPPQESQSGFDLGKLIRVVIQMVGVVLAAILSVFLAILDFVLGILRAIGGIITFISGISSTCCFAPVVVLSSMAGFRFFIM